MPTHNIKNRMPNPMKIAAQSDTKASLMILRECLEDVTSCLVIDKGQGNNIQYNRQAGLKLLSSTIM